VSYFQFVSIEFLAIFAVLVAWKKVGGGLLLIAGVSLLLIPMYRIGLMNDFGMRASLPALTVLAMLSAQLVVTASRKHVVPMLVVLAIGAVTPALEIRRGAAVGSKVPTDYDFSRLLKEKPKVRSQYFANPPGGGLVLRDRVRTASD
jgi:hypothetical protein